MADSDRLATELSALRSSLRVRPPGVEAVVRTVARRRRRRLVALMVTAFVALIAISSAAIGFAAVPDRPDVSTSHSPSPTPSGSPPATPLGPDGGSPSAGNAGSAGGPGPTGCRSEAGVSLLGHDNYLADVDLSIYPEQLCPDQRIEAAWAAYSVDPSGVQHLEGSQTVILDRDTTTAHVSVVLPRACSYKIYFLQNAVIPATITANANLVDDIPFRRNGVVPSGVAVRFAGSNCESMPTVPPHTTLV